MEKTFIDRLIQPESMISIVCFIFSLWTVRATLNNRIKACEEKIKSIEELDLDAKLAKIMSDLEWLKTARENHKK